MDKQQEALEVIKSLGLPSGQQNERSALTLLALANLKSNDSWKQAKCPMLRIVDIMEFMRSQYNKDYAPNSRETVRRQTIHQFEQARIVDRNPDDPTRPTNSGYTVYALTPEALGVLKSFGTNRFARKVKDFLSKYGELTETYQKRRSINQIPLRLPKGKKIVLSPGKHNKLQAAVIREFGPRFAPGARLLYLGDTAKKDVILESDALESLDIQINEHDKMPDIILHDSDRNWLFLIEAVTSHGPVNPKRFKEIESTLTQCPAETIYVTAFLDRTDFRKHCADIAWETEVWISESPEHLIHFDGEKFLGPFRKK